MRNIEFYTFEGEVWVRTDDGKNQELTEDSRELVKEMINNIKNFYPTAYEKLSERYKKCQSHIPRHQFVIAQRFCKCNFGNIDNIPDVNMTDRFNLERIPCPLRGECEMENVVCNPKFNSRISDSEMRVLELLFDGYDYPEIAEKLFLSVHTCRNHVRNSFKRLNIHEKAQFIDYAHRNNLFPEKL